MVNLLLNHGADPTEGHSRVLSTAIENGHVNCLTLLLNSGALNHMSDGEKLLAMAAGNGEVEMVKILLDFGIDPNAHAGNVLELAKASGEDEIVDLLQSHMK
jgi:ankyrin repeat protein